MTLWEKSEYGKFYNGDSYIILNVRLTVTVHCIFTFCNTQKDFIITMAESRGPFTAGKKNLLTMSRMILLSS